MHLYPRYGKPFFDFIISLSLLIILLPLLAIITALLFVSNEGKVWFKQQRPGLYCKPFTLIKFRTMMEGGKTDDGRSLTDEVRLTYVGKWLRRFSLDELPQLWNVLKGDMSLIGPRPLLMEYLPLYNDSQKKRHELKPGITGWAQVNGRNSISWPRKFELDLYYLENLSIHLDLLVLGKTFLLLLSFRKDVSLIEEKFSGN